MSSILAAGTVAPTFTLRVTPDQNLTLSDLRGKPVILAVYPADWSPVCGDQMTLYNEILPEFRKHDAELLGISVDGVGAMQPLRVTATCTFHYSPISNPRATSQENLAPIVPAMGVCERALFVLDRHGTIAWSYCSPIAVNPSADGILDALEKLSDQANTNGHLENTEHGT
jgi:peroxiredoxin